jgi:hypothetical protein
MECYVRRPHRYLISEWQDQNRWTNHNSCVGKLRIESSNHERVAVSQSSREYVSFASQDL